MSLDFDLPHDITIYAIRKNAPTLFCRLKQQSTRIIPKFNIPRVIFTNYTRIVCGRIVLNSMEIKTSIFIFGCNSFAFLFSSPFSSLLGKLIFLGKQRLAPHSIISADVIPIVSDAPPSSITISALVSN